MNSTDVDDEKDEEPEDNYQLYLRNQKKLLSIWWSMWMQMAFMHLLIYYCKQCENIQDVCLLKVNDNYLLWRIMNERQINGGDVQNCQCELSAEDADEWKHLR